MDAKIKTDLECESIAQQLRVHKVTPTSQRVEIARVLFQGPAHYCAEEIHAQVNHNGAKVSKATVYNTLGLFVSKGLVRQVVADPGKVFYDSNTQPHHHIYDTENGNLTDVSTVRVELTALPPMPPDLELDSVDVVIRVRKR